MKTRRVIFIAVGGIVLLLVGLKLLCHHDAQKYPDAVAVVSSVEDFMYSSGFFITRKQRDEILRFPAPFTLRYCTVGKVRDKSIRFGGAGVPFRHSWLHSYSSDKDGQINVAVDVVDGKAFHVALFSDDLHSDLLRDLTVAMGKFKKIQVSQQSTSEEAAP